MAVIKGYSKCYIQKAANQRELVYSIVSDGQTIGKLRESKYPEKKAENILVKLVSLYFLSFTGRMIVERIEMEVLDDKGILVGKIIKEMGFYKDLLLYSQNGIHIATVKTTAKGKAPTIKVADATGNGTLHAVGSFDAIDFTVSESSTSKGVSSIKKRSLIYDTVKENFSKHDVYHIENSCDENDILFELIGIAAAIDIHFHRG